MQSIERNPNLRLVTRNGSVVVPAGGVASLLTVTTDPIPIPPATRFHAWAGSVQVYPNLAADSNHVDIVGGLLFSVDLYQSEDPASWLASFYLGWPPPTLPMRLYVSGIGNGLGQSSAGDAPLIEVPANLDVVGDVRGAVHAAGFSTNLLLTNTDAVNPHTVDAALAALYSIEQ